MRSQTLGFWQQAPRESHWGPSGTLRFRERKVPDAHVVAEVLEVLSGSPPHCRQRSGPASTALEQTTGGTPVFADQQGMIELPDP